MITRQFRWCGAHEHENEYGYAGWLPIWLKGQNPDIVKDFGIAHDCLEHMPKDGLGAVSELKALGAILYIRGETGYFHRRPSGGATDNAIRDIGSVLSDIWRDMFSEAFLCHRLEKPPINAFVKQEETREMIASIIKEGRRIWMVETSNDRYGQKMTHEFLARARAWISIGYQTARRRWNRYPDSCPQFYALHMFDLIEGAVKNKVGDIGQVLTVRIDPIKGEVNASIKYSEDAYAYAYA